LRHADFFADNRFLCHGVLFRSLWCFVSLIVSLFFRLGYRCHEKAPHGQAGGAPRWFSL
jgi:hypothetical protein